MGQARTSRLRTRINGRTNVKRPSNTLSGGFLTFSISNPYPQILQGGMWAHFPSLVSFSTADSLLV